MRRFARAVALVLCAFTLTSAARAAPAGSAEKGRQLFLRDGCYACHGTRGAGGAIAGPQLAPNPLPFAAVLMQLRSPAYRMPLYTREVLSDAGAADIYAYLTSIPAGRAASGITLLNLGSMAARQAVSHGKK
ncbi:MAG: c-type cytochrome [Alphaproteobacteria bacterium]|nr:c-type cytochrome [Alphaproteobacteria bacterium]